MDFFQIPRLFLENLPGLFLYDLFTHYNFHKDRELEGGESFFKFIILGKEVFL